MEKALADLKTVEPAKARASASRLDVLPDCEAANGAEAGVPLFLKPSATPAPPAPPAIQRQPLEEDEDIIQTKPTADDRDDAYEREADQVANDVVRLSGKENGVAPRGNVGQLQSIPPNALADCPQCFPENLAGDKMVSKPFSSRRSPGTLPKDVATTIRSPGQGSPLRPSIKALVEPYVGRKLGHVRVHQDTSARSAARRLGARAFASQNHIFIGKNESDADLQLMAHEAMHCIQQTAPSRFRRKPEGKNADPRRAEEIAKDVYDALDGINNALKARNALFGHNAAMRDEIRNQFVKVYFREEGEHKTLKGYLKDQLDGDDLVKCYALLESENDYGEDTSLALALIPAGTRDEQIFLLLEKLSKEGRRRLELRYNRVFGNKGREGDRHFIGQGSLKADIDDDLSGWRKEKVLALLDRDLTEADHLYFNSVGIVGTHTDQVVAQLQKLWRKGPNHIAQLEKDWDKLVVQKHRWTDKPLWLAIIDELADSPEALDLAMAVFRGQRTYQHAVDRAATEKSATPENALEEARLEAAWLTLKAASSGGFTGLGTNEEQLFAAMKEIKSVWQKRIARARGQEQSSMESVATVEKQWEETRTKLLAFLPSEIDVHSKDFRKARLLLADVLDPADHVYLAHLEGNNEKVVSLITQYWAVGRMDAFLESAATPRKALNQPDKPVMRPRFYPWHLVTPVGSDDFHRVRLLTDKRDEDYIRGVKRLRFELDKGKSDGDLKRVLGLLKTEGLQRNPSLLKDMLWSFAETYLDHLEGDPTERFLKYISDRYDCSHTTWDVYDLLKPTDNPVELYRRAKGRFDASHSGILDKDLNEIIKAYDLISGEDTLKSTRESLLRLQYIASRQKASKAELEAMMHISGVGNINKLAEFEYALFNLRLQEVRSLKQAVADAIALAVELFIEAVITIASGGTAGGMLLASLASAVAGMITRELLLGKDYELLSEQNARQLAILLAGAAFNKAGKGLLDDLFDKDKMGKLATLLNEATVEGFKQVNVEIVTIGLEGKLPTEEEIARKALLLLSQSVASGTGAVVKYVPEDQMAALSKAQKLKLVFKANLVENFISENSQLASELAATGIDKLSAPELLGKIATRQATTFGSTAVKSYAEVKAESRGQSKRHWKGSGTKEEGAIGRRLHDKEKSAVGKADIGDVEQIAVTEVGRKHRLSVFKDPRGKLSFVICSPSCGEVRLLFGAILDDESLSSFHADARKVLQRLAQIEAAGPDTVDDPVKSGYLEDMAKTAHSIISRAGEDRIFIGAQPIGRLPRTGNRPELSPAQFQAARDLLDALAAKHPILADFKPDAPILERLLAKAPDIHQVKGQLLEELLWIRIQKSIDEGLAGEAFGIKTKTGEKLELIEGYRVTDASGAQITDGMLVVRQPDGSLIIHAVFEAKSGKASASGLIRRVGRVPSRHEDRVELLKQMVEPLGSGQPEPQRDVRPAISWWIKRFYPDLAFDRNRIFSRGSGWVDDLPSAVVEDLVRSRWLRGLAAVTLSEKGGQIRSDIERSAEGIDPETGEDLSAVYLIDNEPVPVYLSPTQTRMLGVVPDDVEQASMRNNLRDLGYDFDIETLGIASDDLIAIASALVHSIPTGDGKP